MRNKQYKTQTYKQYKSAEKGRQTDTVHAQRVDISWQNLCDRCWWVRRSAVRRWCRWRWIWCCPVGGLVQRNASRCWSETDESGWMHTSSTTRTTLAFLPTGVNICTLTSLTGVIVAYLKLIVNIISDADACKYQ